jgi:hypothetical protein
MDQKGGLARFKPEQHGTFTAQMDKRGTDTAQKQGWEKCTSGRLRERAAT